MKKKALFLILLFAFISYSYANEYLIGTIKGNRKGKDAFLNFKYNDKNNEFYLNYTDSFWIKTTYWFTLTSEQINTLRNSLSKATKWSKIAKEKAVAEVQKEIPSSILYVPATMKWNDDWYNSKSPITLKFYFAVSNRTSALLISGNKSQTVENPFVDIEWENFIIGESEINSFINIISQENINSCIKKHNEKKQVEDLFN